MIRWDRKTVHGRILRLPLRLIPEKAVLPVLSGPLRGMRWVAGSAPHGAWLGTLEREKLNLFRESLRPGMVVWDIGANVGLYTLCASRQVGLEGRVYAFEPIPENIVALRRHLLLNNIDNVRVEEFAVLDRDTVALMTVGDSSSEWHVHPAGTHEVRAVAIDSWRLRGNALAPQVVKIDVEGSESAVLRGADTTVRKNRPLIYLSLHGETQRRECFAFLSGHGYRLRSWEAGRTIETTSEWLAEFPS